MARAGSAQPAWPTTLPGTPATFAAAWTDKSGVEPDTAGAAVRARIIYPDGLGSQ